MAFLYATPADIATYGATVTTTAGTTDSDYTDEWIADARFGRPARATNGTVTWTLAFSSAPVSVVVVGNCNSDVNATIGGGLSGTVTAGALQNDGTRLNGFRLFTQASITGFTVGFSGASSAVVLGEVIGARYRTLTRGFRQVNANLQKQIGTDIPPTPGVNNYDPGVSVPRVLSGSTLVSSTERDVLMGWVDAQKNFSKPGLIILNSTTVNDAWIVWLVAASYTQVGPDLYDVALTFVELPRKRW